jgi:hypothetical protein
MRTHFISVLFFPLYYYPFVYMFDFCCLFEYGDMLRHKIYAATVYHTRRQSMVIRHRQDSAPQTVLET